MRCSRCYRILRRRMNIRSWATIFILVVLLILLLICYYLRVLDNKRSTAFKPLKLIHKAYSVVPSSQPRVGTSGTLEDLERIALGIFQRYNVVLVTFINRAFLPFAHSWLCNTEPMGIHSQVLVFTTDSESQETLEERWPDVSSVSLNLSSLSDDQSYQKAGYVRVTTERARCINRLLKLGVRVFLFEFDCAWLSNPLPTILGLQNKGDIVATKVGKRTAMATGFLLLNPSRATVQLWNRFTEKMGDISRELSDLNNNEKVEETILDQVILWRLVRDGFAGIKVVYLPRDTFTDGTWYKQPRHLRKQGPRPIIINNNFIQGNAKKIKRARKFGHWFLDRDADSDDVCDQAAVNDLLFDGG